MNIFDEVPDNQSQRRRVETQKAEITCSATAEVRAMFSSKTLSTAKNMQALTCVKERSFMKHCRNEPDGRNRSNRSETTTVSFCSLQILHEMAWKRNWSSLVGGRRLILCHDTESCLWTINEKIIWDEVTTLFSRV